MAAYVLVAVYAFVGAKARGIDGAVEYQPRV
jgi:hypothetical protein